MFDPSPAPRVARFFTEVERVAEVAPTMASRHFAMDFHVIGQGPVEASAVQQILQAAEEIAHGCPSSGTQNCLNGFMHAMVAGQFRFKLLAAGSGQAIEADFAIAFGDAPLGGCPALE